MMTTEPSPGRLFQHVSSHLFSYECIGLRYTPSKTQAEIWYAFFLNEKLGTIIMKTQKQIITAFKLVYVWSILPWWWQQHNHHREDCFNMFQAIYSVKNVWDYGIHLLKIQPRCSRHSSWIRNEVASLRRHRNNITSFRFAYVWSILPWWSENRTVTGKTVSICFKSLSQPWMHEIKMYTVYN
jgi:hypothetical protein